MTNARRSAQARAANLNMEMRNWLTGGLDREDGRLALFDLFGEPIDKSIVKAAIASGYAEPWFSSPMHPQWMVCRLTTKGRGVLRGSAAARL